jgi:hypothetical protein
VTGQAPMRPRPPFGAGSPSKAPAEIVEFVRSQLYTLTAPGQATRD